MLAININDCVEVTLTDLGKHILDCYRKDIERDTKKPLIAIFICNKEGVYKAQLWELFRVFGEYINRKERIFVNDEIRMNDDPFPIAIIPDEMWETEMGKKAIAEADRAIKAIEEHQKGLKKPGES